MIRNGNYKWLNFNKIKPMIKQVFTEYYGEEHQAYLEKIIDSINYVPFHKFDYVNEYYKLHIMNFKDEIVNNFCKLAGLKKSKSLVDTIMPNDVDNLEDTPISMIMGIECRNSLYNKVKNDIEQGQRPRLSKLFETLGVDIQNKEDAQAKLTRIINYYMLAIKQVEKAHPCDVFTDMQTIEKNFNSGMIELISTAEKLGLPVSEKDKNIVALSQKNPDVISLFDNVNRLDIARDYFDRDLSLPGLINYFSTKYEDKLKKSKEDNKYCIYVNRLRYLYLHGAKFELVTEDEVLNFTFSKNTMPDLLRRFEKEYKLQCIKNPKLIVPTKKADLMEIKRLELVEKEHENCKYKAHIEKPTPKGIIDFGLHDNASGLMNNEFVKNVHSRDNSLFLDEGLRDDAYAIISAMIHEINHAISNKIKIQDCYSGVDYMGILAQGVAMDYGKFIAYCTKEPDLEMLYENINQRQTKELCGIYFENYDTKGFFTGDIVIDDEYYDCKYEFADFLTSDFFNIFHEELKRANVDQEYEIYYPVELYDSKIGKAQSKIKSAFERKFHKKEYYTQEGDIDYHKLVKLGTLVSDWLDDYLPYIYENEITAEDLSTGNCMAKFDYNMFRAYKDFIHKKDAIIADMYRDKNISDRLKGKEKKTMDMEEIEYITTVLEENYLGGKE